MADIVLSAAGRPVRKSAGKRDVNPDYVNSIEAINDPIGDLREDHRQANTRIKKRRKLHSLSPTIEPFSPIQCKTDADFTPMTATPGPEALDTEPLQLTFNIPLGFQGPLKIELGTSTLLQLSHSPKLQSMQGTSYHKTKRPRLAKEDHSLEVEPQLPSTIKPKKKCKITPAGFLNLPAELRNEVYRLVFVTKETIDFGSPKNCQRSAAFLRTCHQVHKEATSVLYSENRFVFRRNRNCRNPFWVPDTKEIGYLDMRHFLSMIGDIGRLHLRRIHVVLEDAARSSAIYLEHDGRYTHDGNLLASFKTLAKYCFLKHLALTFNGRRHLTSLDVRFLETLCAIQVDDVILNPNNMWTGDKCEPKVKDILRTEMIRPERLYERDPNPSLKTEKRYIYSYVEKSW